MGKLSHKGSRMPVYPMDEEEPLKVLGGRYNKTDWSRRNGRQEQVQDRQRSGRQRRQRALLPSPTTAVWLPTGYPALLVCVPELQTADSTPGASGQVTRPGQRKPCSLPWPQ